jgi:hypothetical protein
MGRSGKSGEPGEGGWSGFGQGGSGGASGNPGMNGKNGQIGKPGKDGKNGSLRYEVINTKGNTIEISEFMWCIEISEFDIIPVIDDGIFEPGEEVYFTNFKLKNIGGLTLPEGATVKISSENIDCDETFTVSQLAVGLFLSNLSSQENTNYFQKSN